MTIFPRRSRSLSGFALACGLAAAFLLSAVACKPSAVQTAGLQPPKAEIVPKALTLHGHTRVDNYYWLNERENPKVLKYLEAENAYTRAVMKPLEPLEQKLYGELVGRIKQTDLSVPYREDGYYYYARYEEGKDYPVYCRKKGSLEGAEEVLLNVNEMAQGHGYYSVGGLEVSPDNRMLSYGVDTVSRRKYSLRFKNLATGETLPDEIVNTTGAAAWAGDNKTVFYTQIDDTTLRPQKIFRHVLGTPAETDVLIFHEADETFTVEAYTTKSKRFIFIASSHTLSNEYRFIPADKPMAEFKIFQPRERDLEYGVDHYGDKFYVRTNMGAKNFRLMTASLDRTGKADWVELVPHRDDVYLEGFELFKGALVLEERRKGLLQIRIMPWDKSAEHYLDFGEATYTAGTTTNREFDTDWVRYAYTSLTTPMSTFDYNMVTREKKLMKQEEVLGGFDRENYQAERLYAPARDGVEVPVSLVYRKGFVKDGRAPCLLYGYGSYGYSMDAYFDSNRLSLLDRGFVYAIAHIRGGQELGRAWYEDGKLLKKKNTFTDFIDCAEYLVAQKLHRAGPALRRGRQRRGAAHGRRRHHEAGPFQGRPRRRALRRRHHDHARHVDPVDDGRVRRVGESRGQRVLRLHAHVFALRPGRGQGLPGHARDDRLAGLPGPVLRAGQVGGQAPGDEDGQEPAPALDEHGSRARRRERPVPRPQTDGHGVRVHARSGRHQGVTPRRAQVV